MSSNNDAVREFYHKFNQDGFVPPHGKKASLRPQDIAPERVDLKMRLIAEEFFELIEAVYNRGAAEEMEETWNNLFAKRLTDVRNLDVVAAADATGDLRYVIEGFDIEAGIPSDAVFDEIHSSNMSKLDEKGQPILSDGTKKPLGKIMKGEAFFDPDLTAVIEGRVPDHTPRSSKEIR